jgi:hypothetical protein
LLGRFAAADVQARRSASVMPSTAAARSSSMRFPCRWTPTCARTLA